MSGVIHLEWEASPSPDVDAYRVFKASTPGAFNWATPLATKDSTVFYHDDNSAAATLGVSFYAVRPVDMAGNLGASTPILGKVTTTAYLGWTALGNPLQLTDPAISSAFANLGTLWTEARAYDAERGEWVMYAKNTPGWLNTLDEVDTGMGFWLKVGSGGWSLCLVGSPVASASITLHKGWNLVSFPGYASRQVPLALSGVAYDGLQRFDNNVEPYRIRDMAVTEYMRPGEAYWIRVPADCVWSYTN